MAAAVIELNSLPYAIWPAAKDDDLLRGRGCRLVFFLVCRIEVRRVALEFCGARVHSFVDGSDLVLPAHVPNFFLRAFSVQTPHAREPAVGEAHALGFAQHIL